MNHSTQSSTFLDENKAPRSIISYFCTSKPGLIEYLLLLTCFAHYIAISFINLLMVISMAFKLMHDSFKELDAKGCEFILVCATLQQHLHDS